MPLKIRYLTGEYAGRDIDIEDDKPEIRFGRGLDADIPFPEEMTAVSHQHFGLRKEYGGYKFIINREKPVFMDGRPVFDDQDLPKTAEIQLSGPAGPRLKIERSQSYGANQLKTEVLKTSQDLAGMVHQTRTRSSRTAATVAMVALLVVAIAAAGWYLLKGTQQQVAETGAAMQQTQANVAQAQADIATTKGEVAALKEQVPSLKDQLDSLAKPHDFSAMIEQVKGSVYQVAVQGASGSLQAAGTAWVVQLKDGTKALATNSHIADMYEEAKTPEWGEGILVAIEPKAPGYQRFVITSYLKHPGYDAWAQFANDYNTKADAGTVQRVSLPIGYDVAILKVDHPEKLGTPLKITPTEELRAMKAGEQLLQIGYPSENVLGTDVAHPEPTSQTGSITAMTSFFLSVGAPEDRQFIQHNAAGAGGSSGSAMFNDKGEVVGLHNSGNYIFLTIDGRTERVPSAGNINYAQRADLLAELIDGTAQQRLDTVYRPMWAAAETQFSKASDAIVKDQITDLGYQVGGADKVSEYKSFDGTMTTPDTTLDNMKAVSFDVDPEQGRVYLFLASSEDKRNIGLAVFRKDKDGTFFGAGTRGAFFSNYIITYDAAMPARIAVFDDYYDKEGAVDTRPSGKIKLQIFSAPIPPRE